jgi:hypothetical protein
MRPARTALILTGLTFAIWEAVDVFWIDVPAVAAVFAVLFLGCTAWFWRRDSLPAALAFVPLFAVEAGTAPTWKHVMTVTKVAGCSLGTIGLLAVLGVLIGKARQRRREAAAVATSRGYVASPR